MKMFSKSLIVISLLSVVSVSHAAEGFYVGLNVGQSIYSSDVPDFAFLDDGSITSVGLDDSDMGLGLMLGYQFSPYLALEGGYVDVGELNVDMSSDGTGSEYAPGKVTFKEEGDGVFLDVKGILPLHEQLSLYGKIGVWNWNTDSVIADTTGSLISKSEDGSDALFGFGAAFDISNGFGMVADYTIYILDDENVNVFSLGVQYGF